MISYLDLCFTFSSMLIFLCLNFKAIFGLLYIVINLNNLIMVDNKYTLFS